MYLTMEFLPKHQGSITASGERCCAPSSVEQVVSHMGQCFAQMGRSDQWTNLAVAMGTERGSNPVWSQEVLDFKKSYRNFAVAGLMFREVSATPVSEAQITSVLRGLAATATNLHNSPMVAAVAARDGAMLTSCGPQRCGATR